MKFSKLQLISSIIAISVALPGASVYAKTADIGNGLVKEQQNLTSKSDLRQYKSDISAKKNTIKQNAEANKALLETIKQKKTTVKSLIKDIKQGKKQIPDSDLSSIKSELQTINSDITSLEALNGSIKSYYQTIKTDISSKNYQDAEAQFDKIIAVQNTRTTDLTNLSSELDKLISLLQKADSNSAVQ
ncbi:MAG: hypothetical protein ACM3X7_12295 [Solirubrobacterales bacterium]